MTAPSDSHTRHRESPRISANELARYMVAGDQGKIGIITRARSAPTAPAIRYKDARTALSRALAEPRRAPGLLESARERFTQRANDGALSNFVRDDAEKSLDVLDAFPQLMNEMAGFAYRIPPQQQPYLTIAGVSVSVNLDLLVSGEPGREDRIGGLIFRLTKPEEEETERARSRRREAGLYVATLVHMQVAQNFAGNLQPHRPLCWSVDVQTGEIFPAPTQYRQREKNLEAACRMIAASWNTI